MRSVEAAAGVAQRADAAIEAELPTQAGEFTFVGLPDVNGSIRGKAFRPEAFHAAVR